MLLSPNLQVLQALLSMRFDKLPSLEPICMQFFASYFLIFFNMIDWNTSHALRRFSIFIPFMLTFATQTEAILRRSILSVKSTCIILNVMENICMCVSWAFKFSVRKTVSFYGKNSYISYNFSITKNQH